MTTGDGARAAPLRWALAALFLSPASCGQAPSPPSAAFASAPAPASASAPALAPALASASALAPASASASAPGPGVTACGQISCRLFESPAAAVLAVLEKKPRVLGVGEAHAQRGTEGIEPSVRRFTREILPALQGRAADLVVELLLPNPSCRKEGEAARKEQKVVTEKQTASTQNDYVVLASTARQRGIRAHALSPTCDDLAAIAGAGPDAIAASLDVITRLATVELIRLMKDEQARGGSRLVVAYGGAMHNDLTPREGRGSWSFGPVLRYESEQRYVELDLIVPEFIADTESWRSLPWVAGFDRNVHPESTRLLEPEPGAFVLVFPATR